MEKDKKELSEQEKLVSELEELRLLVEKTLKEESERADTEIKDPGISEDMLIQDMVDVELPRNEVAEPRCIYCDKKLSKKEAASGRDYCNSCYLKMKRRPLKMKGILTVLVMIAVFFGSAYTSMDAVTVPENPESAEYKYFFEGYTDYRDHRLLSCASNYGNYLSGRQFNENVSETAIRQLIDTYTVLGQYPYAAQLIERYYSDFELSMPWNHKYKNILEKNRIYGDIYNSIAKILSEHREQGDFDYEKVVVDILSLKERYGTEAEYFIDVFAFDFTALIEKDNQVLLNKLVELDEKYGKEESSHIPLLCHYAALTGNKAIVDDCYSRMMKINCQNMSIYVACFNYYRYLEEPDTEKMLELCHKMAELSGELKNYNHYNSDYLYYFAITYMLTGDAGETSFRMMQELYDTINYYGNYYSGNSRVTDIFNLYALTALYTGNTDAYEWAKAELEYLGYEMGSTVEKYRSGEMTLAQVIADKGGDLA